MNTHRRLLIVGASVRAAAQSARRGGFEVSAIDLFGDADLTAVANHVQSTHYPRDLARLAGALPPMPWLYTGGLENHPRAVAALSTHGERLGNGSDVLRRVRSPRQLARLLQRHGLRFPAIRIRARSADLPIDGSWLIKGRRSTGGNRVRSWFGTGRPHGQRDCYFQQRISGRSYSALYLAAHGRAELVGVCRQIIGARWAGARGFRYAGSIGPLPLAPLLLAQFRRIGDVLAGQCGLVGLFGVDAVVRSDEVWTVEVNPRYTASAELYERAGAGSLVGAHVEACRGRRPPSDVALGSATRRRHTPAQIQGKAIVYARHAVAVDEALAESWRAAWQRAPWPRLADVPVAGSTIAQGWPVLTVLTSGSCTSQVRERLRQQAAHIAAQLRSASAASSPKTL